MDNFIKVTEQASLYNHLEKMTASEILYHINQEDQKVATAVSLALPQIEKLAIAVANSLKTGGRLFYIGAGTSGRLGIVDASECPPTFGIPQGQVIGIIAGGEKAMRQAVEFSEDDKEQGFKDLQAYAVNEKDIVIGLTASGTAPYILGALAECNSKGIATGSICCNPNSPVSSIALYPVEVIVGPEFVSGSTRMKSGTAQKMVLNMISTTAMILLGNVEGNRMVNMQISNEKLLNRGVSMIVEALDINDYEKAKGLLEQYGSVKKVLEETLK
ncbi:N-acetylmuramic acid 6-phosphate etherase [Parasediminibacterium sp. JCM 36343]|uniref:N-acetylmuramic acid 6-phosphate etherase n=1 Tax=Parasediminibacterium sp. JCM 36343 TaxID=3374279 RepID=UPI00397A0531